MKLFAVARGCKCIRLTILLANLRIINSMNISVTEFIAMYLGLLHTQKIVQFHFAETYFEFLKKKERYTSWLSQCVSSFFSPKLLFGYAKKKAKEQYAMGKLTIILLHPLDWKVVFIPSKFNFGSKVSRHSFFSAFSWLNCVCNEWTKVNIDYEFNENSSMMFVHFFPTRNRVYILNFFPVSSLAFLKRRKQK